MSELQNTVAEETAKAVPETVTETAETAAPVEEKAEPKYVNNALAWGLIGGEFAICIAIALAVILPLL